MNWQKGTVLEVVKFNIVAIIAVAIPLFLQTLIPYEWAKAETSVTSEIPHIANVVYILTQTKLSELYTCKPEQRKTNNDMVEFTYDEAQLLLKIARAEGGDGVLGQAWCIRSIVNRIYENEFPDNVYDVIMQDGQFEVVTTGSYLLAEPNTNTHIALAMVEGGWDETEGATYWESITNTDHSWHKKNLTKIKEVEGNIFYHE